MTENEAIEILRNNFPKTCKMVDGRYKGGFDDVECEFGKALLSAISALSTVEGLIAGQDKISISKNEICTDLSCPNREKERRSI